MHTILYLMYQVFTSHCYVTRNNRCVCLHAIYLQGQDPRRPLVIGVDWGIQTTSPHKGISPSRQLQPSCAKPCTMGVLRGSGNTQQRAVMVLHLNKFRTTVCCSKCGARTTAPLVCDYRTHRQRKFTRLREYPACKQQEQGGEGGAAQAGGGEGGGSSGGWNSGGRGPCSSPGTERKCEENTACVPDAHLNAAWNLWNVLAAEYAGLPRPAYLTQPPAA